MGQLSQFLKEQKHLFLKDVAAHNLDRWTVVMGNEAGDLDTAASSLAYAYLSTTLHQSPTIALQQTAHADLALRPENIFAFAHADLSTADLLCIDDLPAPLPVFPRLALVDHNRLGPAFEGEVVGIIDHHDDEALYPGARPRIVRPPSQAGSCTSLVTAYFRAAWAAAPPSTVPASQDLAFLLLSSQLIDTGGLKPDGKAQQVDRESARFLMPLAGFPVPAPLALGEEAGAPKEVEELFTELITKKSDVGALSTRDLLRRDYKQYAIGPGPSPSSTASGAARSVAVGLSTVPLNLTAWLEKDPQLWAAVDAYIAERGLDVCGILTSYRTEKGKHRRQVAFVLRDGTDAKLQEMMWKGLEGSEVLQLERWEEKEQGLGERGRVWKQGNAKATRKQVAPLVTGICRQYTGEG